MEHVANNRPQKGAFIRVRSVGQEAPLRAAIRSDERLLVCAEVRFADRSDDRRVWLTDRRFLFIRSSGSDNVLVSVPIANAAVAFDRSSPYPIHLNWIDGSGRSWSESFRSASWKDNLRTGPETGAIAGATGGIEVAIIVGALGSVVDRAIGTDGTMTGDQRLYDALQEAKTTPVAARPVDFTGFARQSLAERLLVIVPLSLIGAGIIAAVAYAVISFQAMRAYESAPFCAAEPSPQCRDQQPATLTGNEWMGGRDGYCKLRVRTADGTTVTASLNSFNLCSGDHRGESIVLESWRGSVTAVRPAGGVPGAAAWETDSNPEYNWRAGAIIAGAAGTVGVMFSVPLLVTLRGWRARRALLRRAGRSAGNLA